LINTTWTSLTTFPHSCWAPCQRNEGLLCSTQTNCFHVFRLTAKKKYDVAALHSVHAEFKVGRCSFIHKIWFADTCQRRTKCLRNPAVGMCKFCLLLVRSNLLNGSSLRKTLLTLMGSLTDVVRRTATRFGTCSPYFILSGSLCACEIFIAPQISANRVVLEKCVELEWGTHLVISKHIPS
jgi:hypothetical protein